MAVSKTAVLVEEEQGDAKYLRGHSRVHFKSIECWAGRFESIRDRGSALPRSP
ncbi:hypothetical protein ABZ471_46865 [Streptomyces sp. NPDC005728]|uniref:hypothetical protein n=1 Tax=Streptomyces sp. NPDC005728 TaxID=3157054 RepID=UPI0033DD7F3B